MAKKKPAKKSKIGPIAIGIAALAAIGAVTPTEDAPREAPDTYSAYEVIQQTTAPVKTPVEELVETEQEETKEPTTQETVPEEKPVVAVDPEQAFKDKLLQYTFVGSKESDKYHEPTCRWTDKINDSNLVHFDSAEEAKAAGYLPCGTCG